jgi:hypothetical protein
MLDDVSIHLRAATYGDNKTNTENTRTHIHAIVGFELMISVFERLKTIYAVDRAAILN